MEELRKLGRDETFEPVQEAESDQEREIVLDPTSNLMNSNKLPMPEAGQDYLEGEDGQKGSHFRKNSNSIIPMESRIEVKTKLGGLSKRKEIIAPTAVSTMPQTNAFNTPKVGDSRNENPETYGRFY